MTKKTISPHSQIRSGSDHLTTQDQVNVLLVEYTQLTAQSRMHVEQVLQKFALFAAFVLTAFTYASQNPRSQIIFAAIPIFILLIGFITNSQAYLNTVLAGRIKAIEKRINELNRGKDIQEKGILEWESNIAPKFIFSVLPRLRLKDREKTKGWPNPILVAVVFSHLTGQLLFIFSSWRAYGYLHPQSAPGTIIYISIIILCDILMILQSFSFFIFGQIE